MRFTPLLCENASISLYFGGYTYDNAGNRLSKSDGTDNVTYSYDQRNMLTQESKNGIITTYGYDKNGNLTAESDGTQYSYNAFNQLVETDKQDGTWQQNVYDATGLRMATVENGTYTGYTFDRDNILAEYNKDDSMTTRYIRGYDLISQKNDAGETYNYLHNAHGDITKLVDSTGKVQNSYSYDAFGNTTSYSEKVGNKFRYAGEQYDSITDEYYLRARYCDPSMGRFINEDTYRGQIDNPLSLNLYTYCYNNPIIYTDRSANTPMVRKNHGLYYFVPDDPFTNSVDDLYGLIIGGGWINKQLHKVLGGTFITEKDIDFTLDVLGKSEDIGKILKANKKLLKTLHILGRSARISQVY